MTRIIKYLADNKLLVNVIILSIIVISVFSIFKIKQDLAPEASPDVITATIIYPGAAAEDVELNAIIPIEDKLKSIIGIKEYFSIAAENSGRVEIFLDSDVSDVKAVKNEIFRELNNIPDLAPEIEEIILKDLNPKLKPVYEIGVYPNENSKVTRKELYEFVDELEDELSNVSGVSGVDIEGYYDREIKINVDPKKIDDYYISLNEVVDSIRNRNVRSTGGSLQSIDRDKSIVTIGEFRDPMDVKEVIIRSDFDTNRVLIKDIAEVEDSFKKKDIDIRINGSKGVTLKIIKKENADIVRTVKSIKNYLKSKEYDVPEELSISVISDASLSIVSLLSVLKSNALLGFILVFFVLLLFFDFKSSFWTAFSIPIVLMITITVLYLIGFSLNIISLMAMITVLGMLVDDGIVISEIVNRYKIKGMLPIDAAIKGVKEVRGAVVSSSLTTIVAFLPLLALGGMMGKFIYALPIVIAVSLLVSLLEAHTILPVHLAHSKINTKKLENKKKHLFEYFSDVYQKFLKFVLKKRYIVLFVFIVYLAFIIILIKEPIKKFVLLDDDSSDKIYIKLEAPTGTNLETTSSYTVKVENIIEEEIKKQELISYKTTIGHHSATGMKSQGNHENWALLEINLVPITKRKRDADQIINELRKKINKDEIKEFDVINIEKYVFGPPTGAPVDIKLISRDEQKALKAMNDIEGFLKTIPGIVDIDNDQKKGKDELKINFDYSKMARLDINVSSVANIVRAAYEGVIATKVVSSQEELDFRVQIDESFQKEEKFLKNLLIPNKKGSLIKLKDIASLSYQKAPSMINHYNGNKTITITANIDPKITTSNKVTKTVKNMYKEGIPQVKILFGGESKETSDTIKGLMIAFFIALLMIYFILIVLFKSISQPILVMITVPFGMAGALLGLLISNISFSLMAAVGTIGLCGVVVNDNIVMIDFINKLIKKNDNKNDLLPKVAEGARDRLRPIILTTVTTVAGLVPTIFGIGGNAGRITPIAIVMAYGLAFDTFVTLIFLPCLYLILNDVKRIPHKFLKLFKRT